MQYRHLGRTGIQVSELSIGSWVTFKNQVDVDAAVEIMAAAYDHGVNFFDNAEVYASGKSEEVMGAALKKLGWRRGSYLVSTKFYWGLHDGINEKNTLNRKRLIEGINGALQRLDMDYVDLIYCHRPDKTTPIEETVWAMHNIVEWGKALYWGTSEWAASEIIEAIQIAERHHLHKPVVEQPQYNLFERGRLEGDYVRFYKEYGYGTTIWSPLASGLLSGKYNKGIPQDSRGALKGYEWLHGNLTNQEKLAKVTALEPIAKELGGTVAQLALAWCLKNPFVSTVITGASRVEQVHENMKSAEIAPKLTPEIMERIDTIFGVKREEEDDD
ncbi:MAG: aldo/keto reductase [Anaerolineales bacterium]|jgi:voltage-dependent potassium channel beta subunit|uniref:potassium channel beta subunit family protein n=1 Tax=Candidatus Villigracilis vicinus TaxID=3140679 RepID=UPI003136FD94|nr:aldo/keto reductase [Anaerolineales bacterium]MBK9778468.1 aldo/keto reductase [Anaerolineales bacterium]